LSNGVDKKRRPSIVAISWLSMQLLGRLEESVNAASDNRTKALRFPPALQSSFLFLCMLDAKNRSRHDPRPKQGDPHSIFADSAQAKERGNRGPVCTMRTGKTHLSNGPSLQNSPAVRCEGQIK
jgi:hypothetical protein